MIEHPMATYRSYYLTLVMERLVFLWILCRIFIWITKARSCVSPFVVNWDLFLSANMWGSVEPGTHVLHSPLGFVSGLLTFRWDVVPPAMPIMDGLPALASETAGAIAAGPSSDGLGGRGSRSAGSSPARAL